jgi:NAD(P)-dependent dehydrogenase (short-subunit alcohol dehydrogenase family)
MNTSRVAIITGASRGIGLALVRRFKAQGWRVAACSSSEQIHSMSEADFAAVCDVTDAAAVTRFVAEVVKRLGRIDVLINNAGLAGENSLAPDSSDDLWHQIIGVNLHGTYYFSKQVAPHLPNDGSGRIINIASVLALKGVPDQTAYCAAKHGVLGFTRALAHELAPRRITVNAICPGWTRTEMAKGRMKELGLSESGLEQSVPLGRFIEPVEVADLALYLASPQASGITGQSLTIDGGALA